MIILTILVFIFILGLLVFVHELGHFIIAKRARMKVEEFGFGFPPRLFGFKKGETTYSVNAIPLGGFVKILGEEGVNDDPRAFANGTFGARLATLLAGVGMNFVLGWVLLLIGFAFVGVPVGIEQGADIGNARISQAHLTVVAVQAGSPAERAGFKHGDAILAIDNVTFTDIESMIAYNQAHLGQTETYKLQRGREVIFRDVEPRVNPPPGSGPVGFEPAIIANATYPFGEALRLSLAAFMDKASAIFVAFGQLIRNLVGTGKLAEGLSGPVGIAVLTKDFATLGLIYLVQFTAILSINLGIINAMPFPALDGGRVLFLIIEKIRGAKSLKLESHANTIGFILLLVLMAAVTFNDIGRFSEQFKRLFERIL